MGYMIDTLLPLTHRTIIALIGPDTLTLLERLVTHDTQNWSVGTTRYGGLLTPQGKVIADWLAVRTKDGVILDVDAASADALVKRLTLFRLRSQVEITRRRDLSIWVVPEGLPVHDLTKFRYVDPRYTPTQQRVAVQTPTETASDDMLTAYHAHRLAHAIVEQGFDFVGSDVFPADINMDLHAGVALNKGCFVGQEVVSRMHRRGKIRKRTLSAIIDGGAPDLQVSGDIVADTPIGTVTSLAAPWLLMRVRTDRLAKALAGGHDLRCQETRLEFSPPAWLETELSTMSET